MARGFNLTAEINLRGPANIRQVVSNIRRQLGTINANVNVNIDPRVSRNVGNLNTRLNALSATLNQTAASATNATTAFNNLATAMASVGNIRLPNNIPAQINVTANAATNAARAVAQTRTEFEDFGRQAGLAVRRFAAFSSVTSVIYGFTNAISAGIKQYIEFDRQIVRLTQVTNETKAGLGSLVSEITRLSTGFGVASADIANVAVTLAQAGLNANDTRKALEALAKSALAPSFDSLNETVEGSIALMRQFGISAGQLEGALGSINAVAAAFAVEASDLITAIQRTGGVFAAASNGVSQGTDALNEFIAVFTSVRATTRESAETIATGLRTIFTRIQRADTIEALKEYGVVLTDLEGKFVGPYEATRRLAEGLGRLDPRDLKFSQIVEELGGFRQIGKVLPLIQQFSTAQEALKVAQAGQGSLAAEAAKGQQALAVQFQKVREEFSALMRSFGESQSFQALVKIGLSLASALIKVADATKGLLPLIGVMAAFRGVSALTQFAGGFGGGFRGGRQRANSGGVIGFAKGGSVPGVGNSDSVPAMLTPGEFVMSKAGVARAGRKNLETVNRGGRVKNFAKGGITESVSIDTLLELSGAKTISNALYPISNIEKSDLNRQSDKARIKIRPRPVSLTEEDFEFIWNDAEQLAQAGTGKYKTYAGIDISQENRDRLREIRQNSKRQEQKKPEDNSVTSRVGQLMSAEGRWGKAYERLLIDKLKGQWVSASNKSDYPIDLVRVLKDKSIDAIGEAKFRSIETPTEDLISKLLRFRIDRGSANKYFKENNPGNQTDDPLLGELDYFWKQDNKQEFYSWISKKQQNKAKGFNFGGFIQKFANAGEVKEDIDLTPYGEIGQIAIKNKKQDQSIQQAITDTLVKTLADLGNEAGIRDRGVAIPFNLQRKVRKDGITSGRLDSLVVAGILNEAMAVDKTEKDRLRGVRKVAIAGLQPIDYSDDKEWTLDLGEDHPLNGQSYIAMIRGFNKAYLKDIERLRERQRQASLDFAKDTTATEALGPLGQTDTKIYGPLRPLAIDFDETLAFNTKMLDEEGKEDLTLYAMRDKVEAQLAKARPTRLAERLVEVEKKNPGIVRKLTRVLTARPQSTADLVAATLSRFGLPYQVTDITGVSKGLGTDVAAEKAANLAQIERFIDDNEENIKAAEKKGIQSYRYQEPESFDDQKMYTKTGEGNIEGALLEQALAQKLGYQLDIETLKANRAIDFPAGLGNAASLFGLPPNIETEVKRTLSGSSFDDARSEFERYFKENPDKFNFGGMVQRFGNAGEVKDRSTKNIRRGSRGPKGFVPLKPEQYAQFAEQAYAQAGEYGGPGWGDHLGVPLPKPLAEYAKKLQQWVFESGGAGMSLGKKLVKIPDDIEPDAFEALKPDLIKQYDGWYAEIEEILPFGRAIPTKTPAASAREARASAALAAEAGNLAYTQAEEAIGSFKKTGQLTLDPSINSHIQKSFPTYISQLQKDLASESDPDEKASIQRKLSKAQKALPDYQALLQGTAVPNQGRITGLSETLYSLLDQYGSNEVSETEIDNIIKSLGKKIPEKNLGGIIQKFVTGGKVQSPPPPPAAPDKSKQKSSIPKDMEPIAKAWPVGYKIASGDWVPQGSKSIGVGQFAGDMKPITDFGGSGWKMRLDPKKDNDNILIADWFAKNKKTLSAYKIAINTDKPIWTAYTEKGSLPEIQNAAKKAESDLGKFIKLNEVYDSPDTIIPGTGISGRFEIRGDERSGTPRAKDLVKTITERRKATSKYRDLYSLYKQSPAFSEGFPSSTSGSAGVPGTHYYQWLLAQKKLAEKGKNPDNIRKYSSAASEEIELVRSILKEKVPEYSGSAKAFAGGGPVNLYHGSNTGTNDSVLNSFKTQGARSDIASGYGQGSGFFVYTEKNRAISQAKMRVGGGGNFVLAQGDKAGKPMVLTFNETLDPATYDLDYELQKGLVVQWLANNYEKIKDKIAPHVLGNIKYGGVTGITKKDTTQGIMSDALRVQTDTGSRKTIYAGNEGDIREGELIGKIMNRLQANDPDTVNAFESELFKAPLGLVLKYVGANPLKPTNIETFASGGNVLGFADGGYVPALLTPGEAVIGPKMAKRIGYAKLNKMNHADKYASGGEVGIVPGSGNTDTFGPVPLAVGSFVIRKKATEALGFNSGGRVQKFFFGGRGRRAPAARPDTVSAETIGASTQATTALTQLAETLQALGVNGSRSAALLNRGYQATAAEAQRAAQADLAAARAAGAAADVIFDLETAIQQSATATQNEIRIREELGDISGAAIQDALTTVQQEIDRTRATAEATLRATPSTTTGAARTEEEVQADLRAGEANRRRQAYETVALSGGVTGASLDLGSLGADGDDLARVFQVLSRDTRTLDQMNQRLAQTTRQRIDADLAAGRISQDEAQARRTALDEEIRARRLAVEGTAAAERATSPDAVGGAERQANTMRNMAIMTVGTLVANVLDAKSSATEAGVGGAIAGASQTYGATNQLIQEANSMADQLRNTNPRLARFAGGIARVAGRVQLLLVFAEAARQAYNAVRNFTIELEKKRLETALEGLTEGFDKLSKDINQVDLKNELQSRVITAAQSAERQRQATQDSASMGLVNSLDVLGSNLQSFLSGDPTASRQAAARGQVLETEGIIPYLKTVFAGQQGLENIRGRSSQISGRETAAIFKPVAENINQVITSRIKAGESVEDILGGPEAEDFKRSLVMSDASLASHIRSIELDTSLTEEARQARIKDVISISGTAMLRERSEAALREKTQKNLGNLVSVYTRSLQRMFNNMEQAINATVFSLEKMKNSIELSSSAFQGQAQAGQIDLGVKNIIQNPTAYTAPETQRAAAVGGSLYGPRSSEMTQLATLGETITSSVMSTINSTLREQGSNVTNEALTKIIDRNLKTTLKDLGLPPELAEKLAKEVGDSIVDIRKEGEDSVDYAKLSEKIAGLGSVTEVAKNAQQSVIKALEQYQSVLNQYTSNLNRIIELEVSARDRSRKSIQLVTDASLNLAKSLGKTIRVADAFAKRDADIARQAGGLTDPTDIFNQFLALDTTRQTQQANVSQSAERGLSGAADFVKFNNELKNTNIALRENRAALEDMANNTEKASAALDAIQQAQQRAAGRVNFLEKVVTATPDELQSTNNALIRLQRNINGQQNTIQNSIGAQKAYMEALQNGADATEAMRAAQTAFANERKETLGALQDVLPFLGDNEQGNQIKANVLETMLQEAGMGVSPLMQQVLNSLRNPEQDPATAAAIQYYNQAIAEQSRATQLLGQLDSTLADRIAQSNAQLIVDGLVKAVLTFQNSDLRDIATDVNSIVGIIKAPAPAPGIATGGLIYAAAGQMVNFQPRGTDTVPAMLTPGEFVVNRRATQANLPLLQSINNGYANGGKVSYYAAGGFITNYGDGDKTLGSSQTLEKPILKAADFNKREWDIATSELFALPDVYTSTYTMMTSAVPAQDGYGLDTPKIIAGPPVPGYAPGITRSDYKYSYDINNALKTRAEKLHPLKDDKELYFRNPNLEIIDKLYKNNEEKTIADIKSNFSGIEGVTLPIIAIDPARFGDPPKKEDVFRQNANQIVTSAAGKSAGAFFKTGRSVVVSDTMPIDNAGVTGGPALGVYTQDTYSMYFGAGRPHAASLANQGKTKLSFLDTSPYFGKSYSGDWDVVGTNVVKYPELKEGQGLDLVLADKIKNTNTENAKLNEVIDNTREFLKGNLNYNEEGNKLQEILFGLFSGTLPTATLTNDSIGTDLSIFDQLPNAKMLVVAQKNMEKDFIRGLEYARANKDLASKAKVKFGIPGFAGPLDDFTLPEGFKITDTRRGGEADLPFMVNGDMSTYLGKGFAEKAAKQTLDDMVNKAGIRTSTITDNLKLDLPPNIKGMLPGGMGNGIGINLQYTQYTGKLFDDLKKEFVGDEFTYLLPDNISKTLFEELDIGQSRLFTNKKYTAADILASSNLAEPNIGLATAELLKAQLNKDPDYEAKAQALKSLIKLTFKGGPVGLIRAANTSGIEGSAGRDIFAAFSDNPIDVPIGEFFIDKLRSLQTTMAGAASKTDTTAITKGKVFSDKENRDATLFLIRGAMQLFNGIAGLPSGWVANYGGMQAMRVAALGNYIDASSYMSGLFNQAGAYISQGLMPKANSPQSANVLKNAYLMISGASNAFADIAQGNTALLKQFYDQKASIADVFRSYGVSSKFGKVGALTLNGDWKNLLGSQLEGTKIKTVGRDGKLAPSDLSVALPENANVNDLVKLIFNPYNEFPETNTRKDLIQKFGNDLFNLRAENSTMPYFDPMTLSWIGDGLTRLMNWYGGIGDWVGQDYFFDQKAQPDNATRMAEFIESYNKAGQDVYQKAQEAQVLFGLANNLGPLPGLGWFTARAAAAGMAKNEDDVEAFSTGGVVYASTGKLINYQPRGTDTVPAMLTPGEFVVNRKATQANLPLLRAINSGASSPAPYSKGGVVYLENGAEVPKPDISITQEPTSPDIPPAEYERAIYDEWVRSSMAAKEASQKIKDETVIANDEVSMERARSRGDKFLGWKMQKALWNFESEPILQYANEKVPGVKSYLGAISYLKRPAKELEMKHQGQKWYKTAEQRDPSQINIDDLTAYLSKRNDVLSVINPYLKLEKDRITDGWLVGLNPFSTQTRYEKEKELASNDILNLSPSLDIWKDILEERINPQIQDAKVKELENERDSIKIINRDPVAAEKRQNVSNRINRLKAQQKIWQTKSGEYQQRADILGGLIQLRDLGGASAGTIERLTEIEMKGEEAVKAGQSVESTGYFVQGTQATDISYGDIRRQGLREDVIDEGVKKGVYKGLRNLAIGAAIGIAAPILAPIALGAAGITGAAAILGGTLALGVGGSFLAIGAAEAMDAAGIESLKELDPERYAQIKSLQKDEGFRNTASAVEGWIDVADVAVGVGGGIAASKLAKNSAFWKSVSMGLGDTGEIGQKAAARFFKPKKPIGVASSRLSTQSRKAVEDLDARARAVVQKQEATAAAKATDEATATAKAADEVDNATKAADEADNATKAGATTKLPGYIESLRTYGKEKLDLEDLIKRNSVDDTIPAKGNAFAPIDYARARLEAVNERISQANLWKDDFVDTPIAVTDIIKKAEANFISRGEWSSIAPSRIDSADILESEANKLLNIRDPSGKFRARTPQEQARLIALDEQLARRGNADQANKAGKRLSKNDPDLLRKIQDDVAAEQQEELNKIINRITNYTDDEAIDKIPARLSSLDRAPLTPDNIAKADAMALRLSKVDPAHPALDNYSNYLFKSLDSPDYIPRLQNLDPGLVDKQANRIAAQLESAADSATKQKLADKLQQVEDIYNQTQAKAAAATSATKPADAATAAAKPATKAEKAAAEAAEAAEATKYQTKGIFAARKATKFTDAVTRAKKAYEQAVKDVDADMLNTFYSGRGSSLFDAATKNLDDLQNNRQFSKVFNDAVSQGANTPSAIRAALDNIPETTIQDTLAKIRNNGFDIDANGRLVSNEQAVARMMEDSLSETAYKAKINNARQKAIDDMAAQAGVKPGSKDYDALVKGFDDPDFPGFKPRSWRQFVSQNTPEIIKKKFSLSTGLAALGLALGTWWFMRQGQMAQDAGQNRPKKGDKIPPADPQPEAAKPEDEDGQVGMRPEDLKQEAQVEAEAKQLIKKPNYYDELTYKEWASQAIVGGERPPEPDKNLFTTAAYYSNRRNEQGKRQNYRTTAYDQRSSSVDQSVQGNARGRAKGEAATRTAASQVHTRTSAFVPGGESMDMRDVENQQEVEFAQEAGQGRRQGEEAPNAEGFTPVAQFGQPSDKEDKTSRNWATRAQAERGGKKVSGYKSADSQYKSAYVWWRNRLGEFVYYSTKNDKLRDRWRKGFTYESTGRGNTNELEVDADNLSHGGVVYANNGMLIPYQPKGTDTVPAMLTPGEFVVNRAATQKHLPLLKAINSGQRAMSKGGVVYLQDGGIPDLDAVQSAFDAIASAGPEDLTKLQQEGQKAAEIKAKAESDKQEYYRCISEKKTANEEEKRQARANAQAEEESRMNPDDENRAKQALQNRMDFSRRLNEIKTNFRKESYAKENEAMQMSGLGRKELYIASPRFRIENEFRSESGDITSIVGESSLVSAFNDAIQQLLSTLGANSGVSTLRNMDEFITPDINAFYKAANVSDAYLERKKRLENSQMESARQANIRRRGTAPQADEKEVSEYETSMRDFETKKAEQREADSAIRMSCAGNNPALIALAKRAHTAAEEAARKAKDRREEKAKKTQNKAMGGLIYASTGTLVNYQPRGTDTVPAMLTPGEFVVNRKATQKNLGLLKSINSNNYSAGGIAYLSRGGGAYEEKMQKRRQEYEEAQAAKRNAYHDEMDRRSRAYANSRAQGVSFQEAYAQEQRNNPNAQEQQQQQQQQQQQGGVPGVAPQVQRAVGMASQAAFDPRSYGDVNKQMVIFGTLLTGVNQVLVQYGTIITQLNQALGAGGGGGVNGNGEAAQGAGGAQGGLAGLTTFAQKFDTFVQQLQQLNIPPEVNVNLVQNKPWDINVNGADALKALIEGPLGNIVQDAIRQWENSNKDSKEGQQ